MIETPPLTQAERTRLTLLVGDHRYLDFHDAVHWLENNTRLKLATDVDDALRQVVEHQLRPELIVLAQSHPAQFCRSAIDSLAAIVPLARLVTVLGSWCESETRIGQPCPGLIRLYWHQFSARVSREFLQGDEAASKVWSLPRTSTDTEQFLATPVNSSPVARRRLLAIRADDLTAYRALADALKVEGFDTAWVAPGQQPFMSGQWSGIWDSAMLESDDSSQLQEFAAWLRPAPLIVLANFPRLSDWRRLRSIGVTSVLGKPWVLSDLCRLLARSAQPPQPAQDCSVA